MRCAIAAFALPSVVCSIVTLSLIDAAAQDRSDVPVVKPASDVGDPDEVDAVKNTDSSDRGGAAEPGTSQGPIVMGLDLSDAPSNRRARDLTDLYEQSPDQPGKWRSRRDIFPMPLTKDRTKSIWLKYPVALRRYYIQYRSDRSRPETERTYGPFDGDPFEQFKLEQMMTTRLQGSYSPDDIFRVKLMLRTDDETMARRAARLMLATLTAETSARKKRLYLHSLHEILDDYAATFEKHGMKQEVREVSRRLAALESEIEALTADIPDAQYSTADLIKEKLPEEIPPAAWGESHEGLRMAAVPDPDSGKLGEVIPFKLIVGNASDGTIKFSALDLRQSSRADVRRTNGDQVETNTTWFSGVSPIMRYLLKPGERIVVAEPSVMVVEKGEAKSCGPGCTRVVISGEKKLRNHVYVVRYSARLGGNESWSRGDDGIMRRVSPAKGEWVGTLTSGPMAIAASRE